MNYLEPEEFSPSLSGWSSAALVAALEEWGETMPNDPRIAQIEDELLARHGLYLMVMENTNAD